MLVKNAETDKQQYRSADNFRLQTFHDSLAAHDAESVSDDGHHKRTHSDNYEWHGELRHILIAEAGKRYSDSEGVDACGDGKQELAAEFSRIEVGVFLIAERVFLSSCHREPRAGQRLSNGPPTLCSR